MKKLLLLFVLLSSVCWAATDEVSESLKAIPGVYVKDQTGHVHTVDMRGLDANNVLVLINGRRTNATDLSAVDWGQITLNQIEKVNVIKGPASVFYGDNATGGVINFITKKGGNDGLKLDTFFGSFDYYTQALTFTGTQYALNYRHKSEGGWRDNSEADVQNYGATVTHGRWSLEAGNYDAEFGLPGAINRSEIERYGRTYTRLPNDNVKLDDHYGRLAYGPISYSFRNREFAYSTDGFLSNSNSDYHQAEVRHAFKLGDHLLSTGVFYQHNPTEIGSTFQETATIRKEDLGAFFEDTLMIDRWEVSYGFRHDRAYYDFGSDKTHEIANIQTAGVAYNIFEPDFSEGADTFKVYYNWGEGFRNPTTDEFFSFFSGLNQDVHSQRSQIHEIGLMYDKKDIRAEATYFYLITKDEIYFDPFLFQNDNLPETARHGVELALEKVFGKTRAFTYYTFMDAQIKNGGDVPQVPDHKFTVGLSHDFGFLTAQAQVNYVGERTFINDFNDSTPKQKPYKTVDASVSKKIKNADVTLGVDNILDEEYEDIGVLVGDTEYFYPNNPRTYFAKVSIDF